MIKSYPSRRGASASWRVLCAALALSFGLAPATALADATSSDDATSSAADTYPVFLVGPGDLLNIQVYGDKDLPNLYLVDTTGRIYFPLVGSIKIGGMTPSQASRALAKRLERWERDPQVTVLVQQSNHYTISVLGDVNKPGKYLIGGLPTLLSAIAEAGGPAVNADLAGTILIHHNSRTTIRLDRYLLDKTFHEPEPVLYPGDVLMVPLRGWPTIGEWGIIASILSSAATVVAVLYYRQ
jgi:polysaccharide export outer membrane protein